MKSKIRYLIIGSLSLVLVYLFFFRYDYSAINEALSWTPAGERFSFDNWKQLKKDFGFNTTTFRERKWVPQPYDDFGNAKPDELKKDNFSPYASFRFNDPALWETGNRIGLVYPDIEWEASFSVASIIKVAEGFKKDSLFNILSRAKYTSQDYKGRKLLCYSCENSRQEFTDAIQFRMNTVCFDEKYHILLVSSSETFIKKSIDAHDNKTSLLYQEGISELISCTSDAESFFIYPQLKSFGNPATWLMGQNTSKEVLAAFANGLPAALGLSREEWHALHEPKAVCMGEKRNGLVFCNILFENAGSVAKDAASRLKILESGKSLITRQDLNAIYSSPRVNQNDKVLEMEWKTQPHSNAAYNAYIQKDLPWLLFPVKNN